MTKSAACVALALIGAASAAPSTTPVVTMSNDVIALYMGKCEGDAIFAIPVPSANAVCVKEENNENNDEPTQYATYTQNGDRVVMKAGCTTSTCTSCEGEYTFKKGECTMFKNAGTDKDEDDDESPLWAMYTSKDSVKVNMGGMFSMIPGMFSDIMSGMPTTYPMPTGFPGMPGMPTGMPGMPTDMPMVTEGTDGEIPTPTMIDDKNPAVTETQPMAVEPTQTMGVDMFDLLDEM